MTVNREAGRPSKLYTQYIKMARGKMLVYVLKQIVLLLIIFSGKTFNSVSSFFIEVNDDAFEPTCDA